MPGRETTSIPFGSQGSKEVLSCVLLRKSGWRERGRIEARQSDKGGERGSASCMP